MFEQIRCCFPVPTSREPRRGERPGLRRADALDAEAVDRGFEQGVEIHLRAQPQERRAEPDRGAIEEHEFARPR
jgi:hypothetical protein